MIRRALLALTLCLAAALSVPAAAQDAPPAAAVAVRVILDTSAGAILVETDPRAPITAANFLRYVDEGRFDGTDFYRGMELGAGTGVVQGGTANAPDRILPPIAHEPTSQTGLRHVDGALSMARFDPGTADGDFFIIDRRHGHRPRHPRRPQIPDRGRGLHARPDAGPPRPHRLRPPGTRLIRIGFITTVTTRFTAGTTGPVRMPGSGHDP